MKKGLSTLDKNASFVSGLIRAASGISRLNAAQGATGLSAVKNYAMGLGKNVTRYVKKHPVKAGVGGLAGYGAYKAVSGNDNGTTINNY